MRIIRKIMKLFDFQLAPEEIVHITLVQIRAM